MPHVNKFAIQGLKNEAQADKLKSALFAVPHVQRVDVNLEKGVLRVISTNPVDRQTLANAAERIGCRLAKNESRELAATYRVAGMHCRGCELLIERRLRKVPGVAQVNVNLDSRTARIAPDPNQPPRLAELQSALATIPNESYRLLPTTDTAPDRSVLPTERPKFVELAVMLLVILGIGMVMHRFGLLRPGVALHERLSYFSIFFIGLVAASSQCIAVVGGLLLSITAKVHERYANATGFQKLRPVLLFNAGRIASYTVLGGVIGGIGQSLTPSPLITGIITTLAAFYMLVMGLNILHLAPAWMLKLLPRLPKSIGHAAYEASGKDNPFMPFGLGALTFFMPCGFTQALQLYALSSGSITVGALSLFAFALGTMPALMTLGWFSTSVKGKLGRLFFKFSGALVLVLGLYNINNGFAIAGYPLPLPAFGNNSTVAESLDPNVTFDGQQQIVRMNVNLAGYEPNEFTIRQGIPVRWEIDGRNAAGCATVLQVPRYGIQELLRQDENVIEFTPAETGKIAFSCSMGMYRGTFNVVANNS